MKFTSVPQSFVIVENTYAQYVDVLESYGKTLMVTVVSNWNFTEMFQSKIPMVPRLRQENKDCHIFSMLVPTGTEELVLLTSPV